MIPDVPRSVRNNNPGNIEHGDPWQGLANDQPDERFCKFASPAFGFRAIAVTLCTYQDRYGIDTIEKAIRRWSATDQDAYVHSVCVAAHRAPDEKVNFHDYDEAYPVIRAIAIQEAGSFEKYYTKADLDSGLIRAGLENAPRGTVGSVGHAVGGAAVGVAAMAAENPDVLQAAYGYIKPIADVGPHIVQVGFWCAAVLVGGVWLFGVVRKHMGAK